MNSTEAKGNWNEQKGKLKQKFALLTDNDLLFATGKQEEMPQRRSGRTPAYPPPGQAESLPPDSAGRGGPTQRFLRRPVLPAGLTARGRRGSMPTRL